MSERKWKYQLLKFLHKRVENAIREDHLKQRGNDIRCPGCNTWFSVSALYHKHERIADKDWGCSIKCGKCDGVSHWNLVAFPFPALCDANGDPQ